MEDKGRARKKYGRPLSLPSPRGVKPILWCKFPFGAGVGIIPDIDVNPTMTMLPDGDVGKSHGTSQWTLNIKLKPGHEVIVIRQAISHHEPGNQ